MVSEKRIQIIGIHQDLQAHASTDWDPILRESSMLFAAAAAARKYCKTVIGGKIDGGVWDTAIPPGNALNDLMG